jgi:hypothetical protein
VQDIVLEGDPLRAQATFRGTNTVTVGTLDYQACDDKVCFNPRYV